MIKALLIDDNAFIATVLSDTLKENFPDIEVMSIASNGQEGIEQIGQYKPDLVFLDIEMPDMTGFEMLGRLPFINFQTIFTTAHSQYAIKAFRFNALDYLVKPIDIDELTEAILRFKQNLNSSDDRSHIQVALKNMKTENSSDQVLLLNTQQGTLKIPLKHIFYIEGDRNYSHIHLLNGTKELSSKTLGYFDEILSDKDFFRCHRSYLVNRIQVSGLTQNGLQLNNGSIIQISRRKHKEVKLWINSI